MIDPEYLFYLDPFPVTAVIGHTYQYCHSNVISDVISARTLHTFSKPIKILIWTVTVKIPVSEV